MMSSLPETSVNATEVDDRHALRRFFFPLRNQKRPNETQRSRPWSRRRQRQQQQQDLDDDVSESIVAEEMNSPSSRHSSSSEIPRHSQDSALSRGTAAGVLTAADKADRKFVHKFWTTYDDLLILAIFTQVGICFRLIWSTWFTFFDSVFSNESPLFVNLPLNCLSCFIMGLLCSGERLMEIIATRFSPSTLQQQIQRDGCDQEGLRLTGSYSQSPYGDNRTENGNDPRNEIFDDDERAMVISASVDVEVDDDDSDGNDSTPGTQSSSRQKGRGLFRRRGRRQRVATSEDYIGKVKRNGRKKRRAKRQRQSDVSIPFKSWEPPLLLNNELRDVQLLALERRIRMSKCLVLFPADKEDIDVMEHYFQKGYHKDRDDEDDNDYCDVQSFSAYDREDSLSPRSVNGNRMAKLVDDIHQLELNEIDENDEEVMIEKIERREFDDEEGVDENGHPNKGNEKKRLPNSVLLESKSSSTVRPSKEDGDGSETDRSAVTIPAGNEDSRSEASSDGDPDSIENTTLDVAGASTADAVDQMISGATAVADQMLTDVTNNVSENISRLRRVNLIEGWDTGTTPKAMSDDLLLGLRDGFCGALSSFSSWNSAMVGLLLKGSFGEAIVGYMLGLQMPIISYRFGQHIAVYIFVWRARRQTRRDERRGYGLRLSQNEDSDREEDGNMDDSEKSGKKNEKEIPSVRAFVTVVFIIALVAQCTSLSFYQDPVHQQLAMSLLFSPLGVFARWRLSKLNSRRPDFPIGTFCANMSACALGGSLGAFLAGNPSPETGIVLTSVISGFGGTLSSVGAFVVEILAGVDPILMRFDGIVYAIISIVSAMVIVLVFSSSADWADQVRHSRYQSLSTNTSYNFLDLDEDNNRSLFF